MQSIGGTAPRARGGAGIETVAAVRRAADERGDAAGAARAHAALPWGLQVRVAATAVLFTSHRRADSRAAVLVGSTVRAAGAAVLPIDLQTDAVTGASLQPRTAARVIPADRIDGAVVLGADELDRAGGQIGGEAPLDGGCATLAVAEATPKAFLLVVELRSPRAQAVRLVARRAPDIDLMRHRGTGGVHRLPAACAARRPGVARRWGQGRASCRPTQQRRWHAPSSGARQASGEESAKERGQRRAAGGGAGQCTGKLVEVS